jgi:hypothetical protein
MGGRSDPLGDAARCGRTAERRFAATCDHGQKRQAARTTSGQNDNSTNGFIAEKEIAVAKNRNTFQKGQREMEKKRKAQEKRQDKQRKKDQPPQPNEPMDREPEREREEEALAD